MSGEVSDMEYDWASEIPELEECGYVRAMRGSGYEHAVLDIIRNDFQIHPKESFDDKSSRAMRLWFKAQSKIEEHKNDNFRSIMSGEFDKLFSAAQAYRIIFEYALDKWSDFNYADHKELKTDLVC